MKNSITTTVNSPVADGLQNIHKVISRGLGVSIRKCDEYLGKQGIPPEETDGFSMYVTTLKRVTHAHHLGEDEVAFPFFKDLMEAPFSRLQDDHKSMSGILDKLKQCLPEVSLGKVDKLREVLREFNDLWGPHIKIEEEYFSAERLKEAIGTEEQQSLMEKIGEHSSKSSGPGPLTLPFVFYNLEGKAREKFMKSIPLMVRKVLVPIVWKSKWKPMRQFLLLN